MPAAKKNEPATGPTNQPGTTAAATTRKPWVPKTPVEIVLEQITRQEEKVTRLQAELDSEKETLNKLNKAKAIFEVS